MFEGLSAALGVTIVAAIMLAIINALYRVFVNQDSAAEAKARIQELSKQAKTASAERQKELLAETMKHQRDIMRMNMKPMLLSFIVVIVLLPWLGAYYRDVDVSLDDGKGTFSLAADGNYTISAINGTAMISGNGAQTSCQMPCSVALAGNMWRVSHTGDKVQLSLIAATLPGIPIIGGWQLGWIWWYILVSLPLAIIIRAAYGIRS